MISHVELLKVISYNRDSGIMSWREKIHPSVVVGTECGSIRKDNSGRLYRHLSLKRKRYQTHRLAWFYHYGEWPDFIDHINRDSLDNRICNLRSVTHAENQRNKGLCKNNKIGINGVYWQEKSCSYKVYIGKKIYICTTKDFFEACCMRKSAELRLGYHENHGH